MRPRRRPGGPDIFDETGGSEASKCPAPASQEDGGLSGERARARRRRGRRTCLRTGSVCRWEFRGFFQWKDCLPEQLGAGRAWTGGNGGGLSRRVSRGAREALSQAVALKVQREGGGNPAQQASPRQSWGREGRSASLFGPLVASRTG